MPEKAGRLGPQVLLPLSNLAQALATHAACFNLGNQHESCSIKEVREEELSVGRRQLYVSRLHPHALPSTASAPHPAEHTQTHPVPTCTKHYFASGQTRYLLVSGKVPRATKQVNHAPIRLSSVLAAWGSPGGLPYTAPTLAQRAVLKNMSKLLLCCIGHNMQLNGQPGRMQLLLA